MRTNARRRCAIWVRRSWSANLLDLDSMHRVIAGCETMYFGMSVSDAYLAATVNAAAVAKHHGVKAFINMSQMTLSQMSITETTASPQHKLPLRGDVKSPERTSATVSPSASHRPNDWVRLTKDLQPTCKPSLNQWGLSWILERWVPRAPCFRQRRQDCVSVPQPRPAHGARLPAKDAKPVRFVVRLDGAAPGEDGGVDTAPDGSGEFGSRGSISSSGKKVQSETEFSRSNSSIPAFTPLTSRLVEVTLKECL